ncbi:MAG: hypothetical protein AMDU1_APLC00027G0001 [Thermoplasmatales archaeon A-plasma]|jgi:hypothetical protein|nr:MAG: hypothetical protein AMDU1_APLC00027G0001 [Thermoplasmatales archaeon A-plasma]
MTNEASVIGYFSEKGRTWSMYQPLEQYIKQKGRDGLANEFRNDPGFRVVCEYAKEAGELQLRSEITKSVEELVGIMFGLPFVGALDIIIGAVEDACGTTFLAGKLIKSGLIILALAGLGAILKGKK